MQQQKHLFVGRAAVIVVSLLFKMEWTSVCYQVVFGIHYRHIYTHHTLNKMCARARASVAISHRVQCGSYFFLLLTLSPYIFSISFGIILMLLLLLLFSIYRRWQLTNYYSIQIKSKIEYFNYRLPSYGMQINNTTWYKRPAAQTVTADTGYSIDIEYLMCMFVIWMRNIEKKTSDTIHNNTNECIIIEYTIKWWPLSHWATASEGVQEWEGEKERRCENKAHENNMCIWRSVFFAYLYPRWRWPVWLDAY